MPLIQAAMQAELTPVIEQALKNAQNSVSSSKGETDPTYNLADALSKAISEKVFKWMTTDAVVTSPMGPCKVT